PEAVHHQVHELQVRIAIEARCKQLVQLGKSLLKLRRVIAWFVEVEIDAVCLRLVPNIHDGNSFAQEVRQRQFLRLDIRTRKLDSKPSPKIVTLGRVEGRFPNRRQLQSAGTRLQIAPVTANVQHVHEWQRCHFLYSLFQSFQPAL